MPTCECGDPAEYRIYDDSTLPPWDYGDYCAICAVMVPGSVEPLVAKGNDERQ